MSKGTYERRKKQGLCVDCGGEVEEDRKGKLQCLKCKDIANKRAQDTREFRRSLGFCPRCGKNKLFGDEKNCPECRALNASYSEKMDKKKYYPTFYANRKQKRDENRSNGICTYCNEKETDGHSMCVFCRIKRKNYMKKYYDYQKETSENKHKYWKEKGLCWNCGKERYGNFKVCKECYDKLLKISSSENSINAREKRKKIV